VGGTWIGQTTNTHGRRDRKGVIYERAELGGPPDDRRQEAHLALHLKAGVKGISNAGDNVPKRSWPTSRDMHELVASAN